MKLCKAAIFLIVLVLFMLTAYASDNSTQSDDVSLEKGDMADEVKILDSNTLNQDIKNNDISTNKEKNPAFDKETSKKKSDTHTTKLDAGELLDDNENTGDCCTTIMQVSENEAVISFRRDSTGSVSNIYVTNNSSYIKQYKTSGSYFFHVLVSKDGWMVGTGGADSAYVNRLIESRALSMINSKTITTSDLNYIANTQRQLGIAHFIIKAPDGRYGSVVYRNGAMINTGTLKNGEYIVCPNSKTYYHKGNYATYTKTTDPVNASRLLALKDPYGINRRNIMTYHYRRNETTSTIDFYAGNDNGAYVGRSTGSLRDNIVTDTRTISAANLPTSVGGMFIQRYTYIVNASYKPQVDFVITTSSNVTKMGNNISFTANLKIDGKKVNNGYVIFKLNGVTIKDKNNQTVKAYLKDGLATINFTIPDGWSAKAVKLTSVYSRINYGRIENKTYFNLTRPDVHMRLFNMTSTTRQIHIRGLLLDEHEHNVVGENIFAVKVSGLTLKSNGTVLLFKVINGTINIDITLPDYYKSGNHTVVLSTGTRGAYNACRSSFNLNLIV